MLRNKINTLPFQYALVEHVETGKIVGGYNSEDLTTILELLSPQEWDEVRKMLYETSNLSRHKSVINQKVSIAKQVIAIGVMGTLVTYYETENILASMMAGWISAAAAYLFLNERVQENNSKIKMIQDERIKKLLEYKPALPQLDPASTSHNQITTRLQAVNYNKQELEYQAWQELLNNTDLPAMIVDLQAFDNNVKHLKKIAEESGKEIRIATKSIRVLELLQRAVNLLGENCSGLMCYSVTEAEFLHQHGMNNIFIAYPTMQKGDLEILRKLHDAGANISIVVDCEDHLQALNAVMLGVKNPFPVVIDVDMSIRFPIDMGVRRSPVHTENDVRKLLRSAKEFANIKVIGAMGYEAAAAATSDESANKLVNPIMHQVRVSSFNYAKEMRAKVCEVFKQENVSMEIFNGGGSGTANWSERDPALTELAAGNAFLTPHIVNYSNIVYSPAVYIAVQVVRSSPLDKFITCGQGGGIVASGDKKQNLQLVSPPGLEPTANEGFGEVQTPFKVTGTITPKLGSSVLFRPAKAGEATEHFNKVVLINRGEVVGETKTYRGDGVGLTR